MSLLRKAKLSTKARNDLPASAFVFPKDRSYPIHDESHAKNALARSSGKPEESKVKAAVYRRYPGLKPDSTSKADGHEAVVITKADTPMWTDDSPHVVYGVPLSPGIQDSQGDVVSADEIEKTAHRWLVEYRKHDVQHAEQAVDAAPVESYIAPCDLQITGVDGTEQKVLKGAWVLAVKVNDQPTWERVQKGELTGFSIGGSGVREEIPG